MRGNPHEGCVAGQRRRFEVVQDAWRRVQVYGYDFRREVRLTYSLICPQPLQDSFINHVVGQSRLSRPLRSGLTQGESRLTAAAKGAKD